MAAKTTKPRKTTLKSEPLVLHFKDFRLASLKCDRIILPENVKHGAYELKFDSSFLIPTDPEEKKRNVMVVSKVNLIGYNTKNNEGKVEKDSRSFEIEVEVESLFDTYTKEFNASDFSDSVLEQQMAQIYPLVVSRLRELAYEMGYRGVKPELGISASKMKIHKN